MKKRINLMSIIVLLFKGKHKKIKEILKPFFEKKSLTLNRQKRHQKHQGKA